MTDSRICVTSANRLSAISNTSLSMKVPSKSTILLRGLVSGADHDQPCPGDCLVGILMVSALQQASIRLCYEMGCVNLFKLYLGRHTGISCKTTSGYVDLHP